MLRYVEDSATFCAFIQGHSPWSSAQADKKQFQRPAIVLAKVYRGTFDYFAIPFPDVCKNRLR